ncbi:hypothetical protein ATK74_1748 [Propionicimonas paludicola]|uniref:Uncharacterized protein n=1 Tax=Propionicimonas paludicola TaxID=185243 RepID=A0A2A9CT08_9ACTN|nr:hypothetical protein [Propionicimonas paludicola]PFG17185.1 hypothetical protein ATK74_1748 [Propionicimonas paludicola]
MNLKRAIGLVAAALLIGGFWLVAYGRDQAQSVRAGYSIGYTIRGYSDAEATQMAQREADSQTQPLFGIGYLALALGLGAGVTAVALRREL